MDPPFMFLALLPVVIAVCLAEFTEGGLDSRVLAMLGVLTRSTRILRGISRRHGGHRAGLLPAHPRRPGLRARVRLRAGLHVAVRVGAADGRCRPVAALPDAGLGLGRDGRRPAAATGHREGEIAMLVVYGIFAAYAFGLLMNLSGWPFMLGVEVSGHRAALSFVPGAPVEENLHRFVVYTLLTSTGRFDTGRAITNAIAPRRTRAGRADHAAPRVRRATVTTAVRTDRRPGSGRPRRRARRGRRGWTW